MLLAAALGTLAVTHAATWSRSQTDQAAYQTGSAVRVIAARYPAMPSWAVGGTYRAVAGVTDLMPVDRATVDVGRTIRDAQLLAVDAGRVATIVTPPADPDATAPVAILAPVVDGAAPSTAGQLALPGEPARLAIRLDTSLRAVVDEEHPPVDLFPNEILRIGVEVVVADGFGRLHRLSGGSAALEGRDQRIEVALAGATRDVAYGMVGPLRLVAIRLETYTVADTTLGSMAVRGIAISSAAIGDDWTDVPLDPTALGWDWYRADVGGVEPWRRIAAGTEPAAVPGSDPLSNSRFTPLGEFLLRAAPSPDPLRAVVSEAFLRTSGAAVGDQLSTDIGGTAVEIVVVGTAASFPTLDPTTPFVLVDGAALSRAVYGITTFTDAADEWWLAVDPASQAGVVATLREDAFDTDAVVDRDELARSFASDPLALGVIGALALGSLAALAFAAIGFIFNATVSTTERAGEFALLRALGLSTRQLSIWMTVEHGLLLAFGLVAGTALGLLLAWLVLPFATFTVTGEPAVPAPVVVVPWTAIVPFVAIAIGLLAVTALVVARQLPRVRVSGVLRARDE
jgi:FtsX-like permease family